MTYGETEGLAADAGLAPGASAAFVTFLVRSEEKPSGTFFKTEIPAQTGGFTWLRVSENTPRFREAMVRALVEHKQVRVEVGMPEKQAPDGTQAPTIYGVAEVPA
jgi:hypothetical protein